MELEVFPCYVTSVEQRNVGHGAEAMLEAFGLNHGAIKSLAIMGHSIVSLAINLKEIFDERLIVKHPALLGIIEDGGAIDFGPADPFISNR